MLSVPLGYLRRSSISAATCDSFCFTTCWLTSVGGVFTLILNLYLRELNLREDDMGAFSAAQTLAMAGAAGDVMGTVLDRLGIWRSIVSGVRSFSRLARARFCRGAPALLILSAISGVGLAYLSPRLCRLSSPGHVEMSGSSSPRSHSRSFRSSLTAGSLLRADSCRMCCLGPSGLRWTLVVGTALPRWVWSRCSSWGPRARAVGCGPDRSKRGGSPVSGGTCAAGPERLRPGRGVDGRRGGEVSPSSTSI